MGTYNTDLLDRQVGDSSTKFPTEKVDLVFFKSGLAPPPSKSPQDA